MLNPTQTVASLVLEHSACARVFQTRRIDFCCRGDRSIEDAARDRGVELPLLLEELERAIAQRSGGPPPPQSLPEIIAYVVEHHHTYLREALPFVQQLANKVARVHGEQNAKLSSLAYATTELVETLLAHIEEEEKQLFARLLATPRPDAEWIQAALAEMREEHLEVAAILERIRDAADDFTLPEWACRSYRALFEELEALERDTFEHVHLEHHVLAPALMS